MRCSFGDCVLDSDTRQLFREGELVRLGPKAYDLLQTLIAGRPKVLSKLELYRRLWPGTAVSESSLSTVVAELRDALGDSARDPRYIRTVYGFGYAFVAKVTLTEATAPPEPPPSATTLHLRGNGRHYTLGPGTHIVGRLADAAVAIDNPAVSRQHARIVVSVGAATIEDLGSRNGTYRNGQRLSGIATLESGDSLGFGPDVLFHVNAIRPKDGAETVTAMPAPRSPQSGRPVSERDPRPA